MVPFLLAGVGALVTYVLVQQQRSVKFAWLLLISTVVLLLFTASLSTLNLGAAFVDEWCEGQPGGRGSSGPIEEPEDIPRVGR